MEQGAGALPVETQRLWCNLRIAGQRCLTQDPWTQYWAIREVPSAQKCRELAGLLREELAKRREEERKHRIQAWNSWCRNAWTRGSEGKGAVFRAFRPQTKAIPTILQRNDGNDTYTGNAKEIDDMMHAVWGPIPSKWSFARKFMARLFCSL